MSKDEWDLLTTWEEKNVVHTIDAEPFEDWGSGRVKTPGILIKYKNTALYIDILPLKGHDEPSYLDVEMIPFKDGEVDYEGEVFGMSATKEWSEHYSPSDVPEEGLAYPHFAVLVGRKRNAK